MVTNKQIQKWNNYFESLSPEEKRVALAQDVIQQLKAEKIIANNRVYLSIEDFGEQFIGNETSAQKILPEITCSVCALGGLFHSYIKYKNNVNIDLIEEGCPVKLINKFSETLNKYFDDFQLILIETAFESFEYREYFEDEEFAGYDLEGYDGKYKDIIFNNDQKNQIFKSEEYAENLNLTGEENDYTEILLFNIMRNIIRNNGTFVPTDLKLEKWKKKTK